MQLTWVSPAGTELIFSKDSDTYRLLRAVDGFAQTKVKHLIKDAPYQDGVTLIDSRLQPREVSFDVRISAPTAEDLEYAVRVLTLSLNPLQGPGYLIYEQENGSQFVLKCIGNNTPKLSTSARSGVKQVATVDLIAHDPFWYTYPDSIVYFGAGTPVVFPFSLPWMFPATTPTQTVVNAGNVPTGVTIVVSGAITNPVITRTYTDAHGDTVSETLAFTLTMTAGDVLTITTAFGKKTITYYHNGAYDSNPFQYLDADSVFWQLVPGENQVSVLSSAISGGTTTSLRYASRYSGV